MGLELLLESLWKYHLDNNPKDIIVFQYKIKCPKLFLFCRVYGWQLSFAWVQITL